MHVADILRDKGNKIISVGPDDSVLLAARALAQHGIGSVMVLKHSGGILGILSERDIAHGLAREAAGVLDCQVRDLMTRNVETCRPDDTLQTVMERMTHGRFRHLPVVEDGELCGIVSIGDVVKNRLAEQIAEAEALKAYITSG